jgi:5,10-methenyltetrahydromethanopterin hydrogenase
LLPLKVAVVVHFLILCKMAAKVDLAEVAAQHQALLLQQELAERLHPVKEVQVAMDLLAHLVLEAAAALVLLAQMEH